MRLKPRITIVILAGLALLAAVTGVRALALSEHDVKAAYLYNFVKFVQWPVPTDVQAPIDLCVYGTDTLGTVLKSMNQLQAQGRSIAVLFKRRGEDIGACEVLYISASEQRQVAALLTQAGRYEMLTVSDLKGFTRLGGMIGYVSVGNVIRFEINLRAANAANIRISAKLLELAMDVME